jgi:hypothetical protein
LLEDGNIIQSPKRCVLKNKEDGFLIKTGGWITSKNIIFVKTLSLEVLHKGWNFDEFVETGFISPGTRQWRVLENNNELSDS